MPGGSPASSISSASISGTDGSRSDGFRINALPQAIAGANFHIGIIAGKLNGVMPATTPKGCLTEKMSMPGPAPSVYSPFSRCGMPTANSATSTPRWMSPLGVGDRLAVLLGEDFGELVVVALDQLQEFHEDAGAALRIGRSPGRLSGDGVVDGGADFTRCGDRYAGCDLAGHRPVDVAEAAAGAFDAFAADEMIKLLRHFQVPWLVLAG